MPTIHQLVRKGRARVVAPSKRGTGAPGSLPRHSLLGGLPRCRGVRRSPIKAGSAARARRLGQIDLKAELSAGFPDATPDDAESARWAAQWSRGWERRFKHVHDL